MEVENNKVLYNIFILKTPLFFIFSIVLGCFNIVFAINDISPLFYFLALFFDLFSFATFFYLDYLFFKVNKKVKSNLIKKRFLIVTIILPYILDILYILFCILIKFTDNDVYFLFIFLFNIGFFFYFLFINFPILINKFRKELWIKKNDRKLNYYISEIINLNNFDKKIKKMHIILNESLFILLLFIIEFLIYGIFMRSTSYIFAGLSLFSIYVLFITLFFGFLYRNKIINKFYLIFSISIHLMIIVILYLINFYRDSFQGIDGKDIELFLSLIIYILVPFIFVFPYLVILDFMVPFGFVKQLRKMKNNEKPTQNNDSSQ